MDSRAQDLVKQNKWRLLTLLVVAVFINYIDRGNLSVSTKEIMGELKLDAGQMGLLASAFFATYAVSQLLAGWLVERYSVKHVLGIGYLVWSIATAMTGYASGLASLFAFRLILGLGEAVAYPAFSKILARDYTESERGKANGLIDAGSKLGPALSTLLGGLIVAHWGWRALFLILGYGALVWLPFWYLWAPDDKPASASERATAAGYVPTTLELLTTKSVWGSFFGLFAINYGWYFMITWFPYYLREVRHFSVERMAVLGSLPFLMIAITATAGGFLTDRIIRQGTSPTKARKSFIIFGLLMNTLLLPAGMAESDLVSMALFLLACFCFGFATCNHWAVTQTIAGPGAAGKWTGFQNAFGNLAGVIAPWLTGKIVQKTGSFYLAFVAVAVVVVAGALSYAFIIGRVEPIDWSKKRRVAAAAH